MKTFQKIQKSISIILSFILIFNNFLFNPLIIINAFAQEEKEITSLRTEFSKTFQIKEFNNKTFLKKIIYSDKIHFFRNNEWKEVDNTLIPSEQDNHFYKNAANDFNFKISQYAEEGVLYEKDDNYCNFKLEEIDKNEILNSIVSINSNKATYYNVLENIDLEFTVNSTGISTEIIAKDKNNLPNQILFNISNCEESLFKEALMVDADSSTSINQEVIFENEQKYLLIEPNYEKLGEIKGDVRIDPSIIESVIEDTFVSTTTPYGNATRRFLAIGTYYDSTVNATFEKSKALIKFGEMEIPANAQIENVNLEIFYYGTNTNNGEIYVSTISENWTENSIWPGPITSGDFGAITLVNYNSNSIAIKREINLSKNIITQMNYGLSLQNYTQGSPGVVICSKDIPSGPCLTGMEPKLIITYSIGPIPQIPEILAPDDNWELGPNEKYDNVICSQIGEGLGCSIDFKIVTEDEEGSYPLTTTIQITNESGEKIEREIIQEEEGIIEEFIQITDGNWTWKAKTKNNYGNESDWSIEKHFKVDTTAPSIPQIIENSEFSKGKIHNIETSISNDLSNLVQYKFDCSIYEDFRSIYKTSNWIYITEYTFKNLTNTQKYYYQVSARDKYGNVSKFGDKVYSTQDATSPAIRNINISPQTISPENQDGYFDTLSISFDVEETNWKTNYVQIFNLKEEKEREYSNLQKNVNLTFDGKDDNQERLPDGFYKIKLISHDLANNITAVGGPNSSDNTFLIKIDNKTGNLSISYPEDGAWFNKDTIISGITNADSEIEIRDSLDNILNPKPNEQTGVFSQAVSLNNGNNSFSIKAKDLYENISSKNITIYYENNNPELEILNNSLTNNPKPNITIKATDYGFEDYVSGINSKTAYLSIYDENQNEIVLINQGVNVSALGHLEDNCNFSGKYGLSKTFECTINYIFDQELQPDGIYKINAQIKDVAGNVSNLEQKEITIDTKAYLEIEAPTEKEKFNYSHIKVSGIAEKDATLEISKNTGETKSYKINLSQTDESIQIENCRINEDKTEICDWEIPNFELDKNDLKNTDWENLIIVKVTDNAGNVIEEERIVYVNLYNVNLAIDSDFEYFSSNGDGEQDGINFINIKTDAKIKDWNLKISNEQSEPVKTFGGSFNLPESIYWDGKDERNNFVTDGNYFYQLEITTIDDLVFKTESKNLYARTEFKGEVIITNPKNNSVTTRGVTNLQGLAPKNSDLRICVNVIGIDGSCDLEYSAKTNTEGIFSTIIPLLRLEDQNQTENQITVFAIDEYGNQTLSSNIVSIFTDIRNPFNSISILPSITGVNTNEEYQSYLDKIENDEIITSEDLENLKTVIFRSNISQNTEWVSFEFADFTNLEELPELTDYENIGWIDDETKSNYFTSVKETAKSCDKDECTWDFNYIIPPVNGGIYEIKFIAKKGETIETLYSSLIIDGTIPEEPQIIDINKINESSNETENLNIFENTYYSNSKYLEFVGVAESNNEIEIFSENEKLCSTKTNAIGIFSCNIDLERFYPESYKVINLKISASDGLNKTLSKEETTLIIDQESPEFLEISTDKLWNKSGTNVELSFKANESINYGFVNSQVFSNKLTIAQNKKEGLGKTLIETDTNEGFLDIEFEIFDLAGNQNKKSTQIFIDNTNPDNTEIETDNWNTSGINSNKFPSIDRLSSAFVTKNSQITISGHAEKDSTVLIYVNGESKDIIQTNNENCYGTSSGSFVNGIWVKQNQNCLWSYNLNLEEEKGYVISAYVKDKAGNLSEISKSVTVYFDKTPPNLVEFLNLENQTYNESISFSIETERSADIELEVFNSSGTKIFEEVKQNNSSGITDFDIGLAGIGEYKIKASVYDSAGNLTSKEEVTSRLEIPQITIVPSSDQGAGGKVLGVFEEQMIAEQNKPEFNNSIQGASTEDPWAGKSNSDLNKPAINVQIKYDGSYKITSYSVPSPILSMIDLETYDGKVYGYATAKNQNLTVNYDYLFATFNEARNSCNVSSWKPIGLISGSDKDCIESKMGIDNLKTWYAKQSSICSFLVIASPICLASKLNNERVYTKNSKEISASNVMVSFYKNDNNKYIGSLWNDDSTGRFVFNIKVPDLVSTGEEIHAKTSIFGDFEINGVKIDYRMNDNSGIQSNLSSPLTVGNSRTIPDFIEPYGNDANCQGTHNSKKQYTVAEAAIFIGNMLVQSPNNRNYYSKFKCSDPNCAYIPEKVKEMYTKAGGIWNPKNSPNDYVQCITFVYMAYSLGGNPITKVKGNAVTFSGKQWNCSNYVKDEDGNDVCTSWYLGNNNVYASQFNVYKSGETTEMPQVGDVMVWDQSAPYGHVGIVTNVDNTGFRVYNSNSTRIYWDFSITKDSDGKIKIAEKNWKPLWWARKK